eukprot:560961-Hanusia_phi.AAC.1
MARSARFANRRNAAEHVGPRQPRGPPGPPGQGPSPGQAQLPPPRHHGHGGNFALSAGAGAGRQQDPPTSYCPAGDEVRGGGEKGVQGCRAGGGRWFLSAGGGGSRGEDGRAAVLDEGSAC